MSVLSNTDRLTKIRVGHSSPRKRTGRRSTKTTSQALRMIRTILINQKLVSVKAMEEFVAIDRTRLLALRRNLEKLGAVKIERHGRKLYWVLVDDSKIEFHYVVSCLALEPRPAASNTHPGWVQIDCPLCGLQTRPWPLKELRVAWREHLESVCHQ